ncbi:MAG: hypothetical protein LBP78_04850, partial [Acidaminococcales bacterium]|nr:hypothetical protein [Acidaminococcales bacterium]
MHNLLQLITAAKIFRILAEPSQQHITVSGVDGTQKAALAAALFTARPGPLLIAAPGREELREMRRDLNALLPDAIIEEFYPADRRDIAANHKSLEITAARLAVLRRLRAGRRRI